MKSSVTRKKFLAHSAKTVAALTLGSSVAAVAAVAACRKREESQAPSSDGKIFRWKMVTTWPKNFPGLGTGASRLAQRISSMSNGRIQVKVYAAGELVPAFECFDAVSQGTAEMGHGAAYYWKGKVPAAQFFTAIPFGLHPQEMNAWIHYGGAQKLWDNLYADFNLKPFPAGNTGLQMGGWFNKEINQVADFRGLKMRIPGLGGEVLRQLGTTVVNLPGGEIFSSMQSGTIDATEWVGPYNDLAFGFHKVAKYYYWPGWQEPGSVMELIVNRKKFEELPKDLQEIISIACQAGYNDMLSELNHHNSIALENMVKTHKVKLRQFSNEILQKLAEASQDVVSRLAKQETEAKKIYNSFQRYRSQTNNWDKIGLQGFAQARNIFLKT